jgi:thiamine biosynthesis lipoprotein
MGRRSSRLAGLVLGGLLGLAAIGWWMNRNRLVAVVREPPAVMGTTCTLIAIVPAHQASATDTAFTNAERSLRLIESRMSSWIDASEISRFNRAAADCRISLSESTYHVFEKAKEANDATGGAFDVTCRPLIELWRSADESDVMPTESDIRSARDRSNWSHIQLGETAAAKSTKTARVDLGGIAKGYAIDQVVEVFKANGIESGLVDIGGDQRFWGTSVEGRQHEVAIRNPLGDEESAIFEFRVWDCAVCTSGDYARSFEVGDQRFSHIIDPQTGRPVVGVASVTVFASDALTADIWATALSVKGTQGLKELPKGIDALMLVRRKGAASAGFEALASSGLADRIIGPLPDGVEVSKPD